MSVPESQSYNNVGWYVHLQRNWVPYERALKVQLEDEYQKYLLNALNFKSSEFQQVTSQGVFIYYVNFETMVQMRKGREHLYRNICRLKFIRDLSQEESDKNIPLTYNQIINLGGHPKNYLTPDELNNKCVEDERSPNFCWHTTLLIK